MTYWHLWCFALGAAIGLWVRRLPSEGEFERFMCRLDARGRDLARYQTMYSQARMWIGTWRTYHWRLAWYRASMLRRHARRAVKGGKP